MGDAVTGVASGVGDTTKGTFCPVMDLRRLDSDFGGIRKADVDVFWGLCSRGEVCGGYDASWGKECSGGEEMN